VDAAKSMGLGQDAAVQLVRELWNTEKSDGSGKDR